MTKSVDKVTRMDARLVDSAIAEGKRQQRTGRQQLEHWALVGRSVTAGETAATGRIAAALRGDLDLGELTNAEGVVFNAEVHARISERVDTTNFRSELAARGITTVSLNAEGQIEEFRPDGTRSIVGE